MLNPGQCWKASRRNFIFPDSDAPGIRQPERAQGVAIYPLLVPILERDHEVIHAKRACTVHGFDTPGRRHYSGIIKRSGETRDPIAVGDGIVIQKIATVYCMSICALAPADKRV